MFERISNILSEKIHQCWLKLIFESWGIQIDNQIIEVHFPMKMKINWQRCVQNKTIFLYYFINRWNTTIIICLESMFEAFCVADEFVFSRFRDVFEHSDRPMHTCKKRVIAVIYHRKFFWIFRKILGWEREINTAPKPSPEVAPSKMEVAPS